ncbi:hypothetical protein [Halorubrum vacuolatum]|uniref:Uncharacterized protein n=1 Tax=Halorubrum vacuolatum TaxID=63740 RepID=A0A238Y1F9_HALVU|nr:hypothetical protein [Halorubrum vacuolatum]SNR64648.1 hypothetical protein SAMN06264855_1279 [Halorubrum vacuolatum]
MSQHYQPTNEAISTDDTDAQPSADTSDITDKQKEYRYRCPICETIYENEITARVHITRSDDEAHKNTNGLMPEAEVEVLSQDGDLLDTVSRQPDEIDLECLTVDQLPDDFPEHHRHIIRIATTNPYKSYSELEEIISSEFSTLDLDVPSYSTIHRVVRDYYHPQAERTSEKTESLDELTAKQQAIIIARALLPDATKSQIASKVGSASSYPAQVFERAPDIVQRFERSSDDEINDIIKSELTPESIDELISRGLVDDLPIEFDSTSVATEEADSDNDSDAGQQSLWGSPVDNQTGLRAVPEPEANLSAMHENQEKVDSVQDPDSKVSVSESTDTLPDEDTPYAIVADLHREVSFLEEVFERMEPDHNVEFAEAVIKTVAGRCESILKQGDA